MRARAVISTITVAAFAAVLSGCSVIDSFTLQEFEVGQCLDTSGEVAETEGEVGHFPVVDCGEPHDAEVYAVVESAEPEFDIDAIEQEADLACYEAFESYVGLAWEDSSLYYSFVYPSSRSWDDGDRQIACLLIVDGQTGSLKDSGI